MPYCGDRENAPCGQNATDRILLTADAALSARARFLRAVSINIAAACCCTRKTWRAARRRSITWLPVLLMLAVRSTHSYCRGRLFRSPYWRSGDTYMQSAGCWRAREFSKSHTNCGRGLVSRQPLACILPRTSELPEKPRTTYMHGLADRSRKTGTQ